MTFAETTRVLWQRSNAVRALSATIGHAGQVIDRKRTFLIGVPPNLAEIVRQAVFNRQTVRPVATLRQIAAPGSFGIFETQTFRPIAAPGRVPGGR